MMQELIALLGGVSVLALLVALVTSALGLRRRAIRRGLSWAEAVSPWWAWLRRGLLAWSPAAGGGSSAPTPRQQRTSRVWRACLVLVWVAAIPSPSALSPLPARPDLVAYTSQVPARLATNGAAALTQAEALSVEYQYYVPFNDVNLWTLFNDKDTGLSGAQQCHATGIPVAGTLSSSIFLVASADGTVYYYDHWEDGYDADPLVPGPTTESRVLDAGDVQLFQSDIDPTQVGGVLYYDGRDRITLKSWVGAAVVRLVFPSTPGVVLAAAWEVPEVSDWGTHYVTTVGEDLDFNVGGVDDHDFTGLEVMAALPGTEVYYNGVQVATLGPGQTFFVDGANDGSGGGGVDSIDTIDASAPVQIQMLTGGCGARYSAHGYTLRPVTEWGNEYWAPVPGFSCGDNVADSDIYLQNHNSGPIGVTVVSDQGTVVVPIPAHTTISLLYYVTHDLVPGWEDISTGSSAVHLFSADPFRAMAVIDSASNGLTESQVRDWGYTVIPVSALSAQVVVGYAPGNRLLTDNGNSAFVVATRDTVLYVDLDQNGVPDAFDMNGDGDAADNDVFGVLAWDEPGSAGGIPLLEGQTTRVGDPNDQSLEGALIYASDYQDKIAVAWGQDPCQAGRADPYLDLGYTVLPLAVTNCAKKCDLDTDADQSDDITPGDTFTWTLVLANSGLGSLNSMILTDSLHYTYTDFVVGSLGVTTPPAVEAIEYSNDGINFDAPPNPDIQAFRIRWPTIGSGQVVTITFRVTLHTDIPPTVTEITNQAEMVSANIDPCACEEPCLVETPPPTKTPTPTMTPTTPPPPPPTTPPPPPPTTPPPPPPTTPPPTTPTPTTPPPTTPTPQTPPPTVVTVERLPETGSFPGCPTVCLGIPVLVGVASLLNLALLEMRGRRGNGKGD